MEDICILHDIYIYDKYDVYDMIYMMYIYDTIYMYYIYMIIYRCIDTHACTHTHKYLHAGRGYKQD